MQTKWKGKDKETDTEREFQHQFGIPGGVKKGVEAVKHLSFGFVPSDGQPGPVH